MKARRSARDAEPGSVWLAIYACGAFHCSRSPEGAARTGLDHQSTCCARGGHTFDVVEYKRHAVAMQSPALPQRAPPPDARRLRLLMRRLERRCSDCTQCGLSRTRQKVAFGRGNPEAPVCFVGEAPGAEEDAQGKPFVGRAGRLLDEMIQQMGLSPDDVYICNIVKCRPPDNRKPTPAEIRACSAHLHEQLSLWAQTSTWPAPTAKRILVALGNTAISTLLDTRQGVSELRGKWKLYRGRIMVMPTYHPSFLMRPFATQAQSKKEAASDLSLVAKELGLDISLAQPARRTILYSIEGGKSAAPKEPQS
jgi:uracil-DNA glycosylase family 4